MFLWLTPFHCSQLSQGSWITGRKELELPQHQRLCHPITFAQEMQPRKFLLGFCAWECIFFFSFLDRAYSSPMIQKLRRPEPDGFVFVVPEKVVRGMSPNNKFRQSQSLWFQAGGICIHFPRAVEPVTCPLWVLRVPQRILSVFLL